MYGVLRSRRVVIVVFVFPAEKNKILQGLENVEALEGGEALFECYLSKPECYNFNWLVDDEPAKSSDTVEMVYFENGRRHLLLLKNLTAEDSCRVTFMAGDAASSAFLSVRGESSATVMALPPSSQICHSTGGPQLQT